MILDGYTYHYFAIESIKVGRKKCKIRKFLLFGTLMSKTITVKYNLVHFSHRDFPKEFH